jgi:hypothetical protein
LAHTISHVGHLKPPKATSPSFYSNGTHED